MSVRSRRGADPRWSMAIGGRFQVFMSLTNLVVANFQMSW